MECVSFMLVFNIGANSIIPQNVFVMVHMSKECSGVRLENG